MKIAKLNTIVYVRAFEGYPLVRCTLKGVYYGTWSFGRKRYFVIKPLETKHGYYKGVLDTCKAIIPASCCRWLQKGLKFAPKPFTVDFNSLPLFEKPRFRLKRI